MRKTGQNDPTACLEEGEAVRFAHLQQQKIWTRQGVKNNTFALEGVCRWLSGVGSFAVISKKNFETASGTREKSTCFTPKRILFDLLFSQETYSPTGGFTKHTPKSAESFCTKTLVFT